MRGLPKIVVTESIDPGVMSWICGRAEVVEVGVREEGFEEALGSAEGLVVRTYTSVDEGLLSRAPALRVVGRAGVGLDNVDVDACAARGVRVLNTPHANAMAVVEYTMSMVLRAMRPIDVLGRWVDDEGWHRARREGVTEKSVVGSTMGIIGMGYIGSRVARAARALGMEVVYHDLVEIDEGDRHGGEAVSMEALVARSDVISVHVDGRASNRGLIGGEVFEGMKAGVVFVNASRGFVVDTEGACGWARAHGDAVLVLDVHDPEPIPEGSGVWGVGNVWVTAHMASGTREAKRAMSRVVEGVYEVLMEG